MPHKHHAPIFNVVINLYAIYIVTYPLMNQQNPPRTRRKSTHAKIFRKRNK